MKFVVKKPLIAVFQKYQLRIASFVDLANIKGFKANCNILRDLPGRARLYPNKNPKGKQPVRIG